MPKIPGLKIVKKANHTVTGCTHENTLDSTWYAIEPQTVDNLYHAHNDNIFPLYRALALMGDTK